MTLRSAIRLRQCCGLDGMSYPSASLNSMAMNAQKSPYSASMGPRPSISPDHKTLDRDTVAQLPKVELHDHIDGGLRPSTLLDLAQQSGYSGLPDSIMSQPEDARADALEEWFRTSAESGDLPSYLELFARTTAVMQTAEAIERVTREAVEDLARDGVVYAELRFAPEQHQEQGLDLQHVVDAAIAGVRAGEQSAAAEDNPIVARLILCAMRNNNRSTEIARLVVDNAGDGSGYVVGFDLAGPEEGFSVREHAEALELLRENLVPFTIHAGEADGVGSMKDALALGASRIGHGARIYEDFGASLDGIELGPVAARVRDRTVALELCPTSNRQTGLVDSMEDHPLSLLYELGFTCTVNTDNRTVSGTTMTDEMLLFGEYFDFGYDELLHLTLNAMDAAFLPLLDRQRLARDLIIPAYEELVGDPDMRATSRNDGSGHHDDGADENGAEGHSHDHAHGAHGHNHSGAGTLNIDLGDLGLDDIDGLAGLDGLDLGDLGSDKRE